MDALGASLLLVGLLLFFLGVGVWIFTGLMLVASSALLIALDMPLLRVVKILESTMWKGASTWELAAIPIFIWMGELIYRTDISNRLFRGLTPWVALLPGRLLHTNVAGCTLFAAVSGSSTATTATIGKVTLAELRARGYDRSLSIGSLAGAGSLGLMIPPSIVMIVYGVLAEVSIARLFAAGVIPGLIAATLYSTYIVGVCTAKPALQPQDDIRYSWADRLRALKDIAPVAILVPVVLGGVYSGLATPSEAAALGVAGTLTLVIGLRQMSFALMRESLLGATKMSAMIISIVVAALFLSAALGYLHVPQEISKALAALDLGPYGLILLIGLFYLLLGTFLEGLSIMVMTLPVTLPLVVAGGWDPIWFGVFVVITVELATVTPPVGFNLFVLQALTGEELTKVSAAALPFFLMLVLSAALLVLFPGLVTWLPDIVYN